MQHKRWVASIIVDRTEVDTLGSLVAIFEQSLLLSVE
jgi:hypothetical protein